MQGSTGVKSEHPLVVRLREIGQKLQSITETDKAMLNASKKGERYIKGFYEGAIQNGTLAAKLLREAIRLFPLSPESVRTDANPGAGRSIRKGGKR